jgi:DNA-binding beta-propeller fold protein YncE
MTYPRSIAVDSSGKKVYATDTWNNRIQKFSTTDGINYTLVKTWGSLGSGDGQFNYPYGIAVDPSGNIYVADTINNRIQKFAPVLAPADTTPPTITITSPTEGLITSQNVTLTYSVSDNVSPPADIRTSPSSGTVYSTEGSYNITVTATDEAGNTAAKSVSFTIYAPITGNPEVDTAMGVLNNKYTDPETGLATHGTYVSAVTNKVNEMRKAGKITKEQGGEIVKKAAQSSVNMP